MGCKESKEIKKITQQTQTKDNSTSPIAPAKSNPEIGNFAEPNGQQVSGSVLPGPGDPMWSTNPTSIPREGIQTYIALCDYDTDIDEQLGFKKGDKLQIINQDNDRWQARCITSKREGYIPFNCVTPIRMGSIDFKDSRWFFDRIKRSGADFLLLTRGNNGTYLVRKNETLPGTFSLSIRTDNCVKHYRIKNLDTGEFFIKKKTFTTLEELITHYTDNADGLCSKLKNICPKVERNKNSQTVGLSYIDMENLEINRSLFKLGTKLGGGQFGEVWEGIDNNSFMVAIKMLRPGIISREDFLTAATTVKKLHHDNLVQLYAVCTCEEPIYIVTEYMDNGTLLEFLQKGDGCKLEIWQLIDVGAQVACGMAHLELHQYTHGNLAARNVLIGEDGEMKVADFGLVRVIEKNDYLERDKAEFPIKWTAPEAALFNRFTIKSDVWSFGILLMEIITHGCVPYPGMNNAQVLAEVTYPRNYRMPKPSNTPNYLYQIILNCWKSDEYARPTFECLRYQLEDFDTEQEPRFLRVI